MSNRLHEGGEIVICEDNIGDLSRDRLLERTEDGWLLRGDPAHLVDPVTDRLMSPV